MAKKLCPIHHLWYGGMECPLCMQERIQKLEKKLVKTKQVIPVEPIEVTPDLIAQLKEKYNSR